MRQKKAAMAFSMTMVLIAVVALIYAWTQLNHKYNSFNEIIGEKQYRLIATYNQAENSLFYIDTSAKYSLQQAVYDLAKNGGISEVEEIGTDEAFAFYECGKFSDAYVWLEISKDADGKYIEKDCFDEKQAGNHLSYLFDNNLDKYLENAPYNIPLNNYDYETKGSLEMIGIANEPMKFDIYKNEKEIEPKPKEFYVDREGKVIVRKPEEKPEIASIGASKSLVDFTGLEKAKLGSEEIGIKGLCPKGRRCVLTKEAFEELLRAQKTAKQKGVSLEIRSSYRSLQQQINIWEGKTPEKYKQRFPNEQLRRKYVCYPYGDNVEKRCTHLMGKAVDIRLQNKQMNSNDWKLLYQIMITTKNAENQPAWVKLTNEPWHFECCETDRYARAIEKGVTEIV
ncbi:D-alanyl-D-alanine carboxypeptidase family protein [Candidatus Woesearchaeota archaeon]|nr:D-alanyl-D-alanine carboxypeptidase family protein [Candidatus Woesearchaeota archaeon]